ncbi:rod shape-determining protein MreC [Cocleimonas flava]|jgi:rod shape-determining protein MreC|uniref:Cell shape-determining protein MreC n=1 Tax=Cocleimonas flava TaxID=634765 RepID=A0A4R1F2U6_9GAMM|nr:rod shape-determining protein MreC [Cocleimonas flava]TCJ88506.1 rod shape-determining protein MreC [Cocleimonas flava]
MIKFVILALISMAFMTLDYRKNRLLPVRTGLTKFLIYPVQYTVDLPYRLASFTREFFSDHDELSKANRELRALVGVYAARDQKYHSIARENQRLRSQLSATPAVREKFTLTEILSVSSNPFSKNVVINKGTDDGIFVGQVALAGNNIYGQTESVTPNSAVIMQLTDAKHAIHVRNVRTGQGALAVGTGKINRLELKHVETSMDIQTGDKFVSSGLGQLFPPDFPVAIVDSVAYNPGDSFMKVHATPFTDFSKTREILMIWRADYSSELESTNNMPEQTNGASK